MPLDDVLGYIFLFACYLTLFHLEWEVKINKIHVSGQTPGNRTFKAITLFSKESGKFGFSTWYFMFLLGTKSCPNRVLHLCQRMRSHLSPRPPPWKAYLYFCEDFAWEEPLACFLLSLNLVLDSPIAESAGGKCTHVRTPG